MTQNTGVGRADGQRERIYLAARSCFDRYGFKRTFMEDVAQEAGVSRQTVYYYFPDRMSLVLEVAARQSREILEEFQGHLLGNCSSLDSIVDGLMLLMEHTRIDPYLSLLIQPRSKGLAAAAVAGSQTAKEVLEAFWHPLFDRARAEGELRTDLGYDELLRWIELVGLALLEQGEQFGLTDDANVRRLLRAFVLPSFHAVAEDFLAGADPAQSPGTRRRKDRRRAPSAKTAQLDEGREAAVKGAGGR